MLSIFNGLVVASTSSLHNIIMVFRVSFEGYFSIAIGAFEVEPENLDAKIHLFIANFHSHVKLGSNVEVVSTCITPQTHRQHIPDHHEFVLTSTPFDDQLMIEIFRVIFD